MESLESLIDKVRKGKSMDPNEFESIASVARRQGYIFKTENSYVSKLLGTAYLENGVCRWVVHPLVGSKDGDWHVYVVDPPAHVVEHYHPTQETVLMVLHGRMRWRIGDKTYDVEAGDVVYVPERVPHETWHIGDEPILAVGGHWPAAIEIYATEGLWPPTSSGYKNWQEYEKTAESKKIPVNKNTTDSLKELMDRIRKGKSMDPNEFEGIASVARRHGYVFKTENSYVSRQVGSTFAGERATYRWVVHPSVGSKSGGFHVSLTNPPIYVAEHYHPTQEDVVMVLHGRMKWRIGDKTYDVEAGDVIYVPERVPHETWHIGDEPILAVGGHWPAAVEMYAAEGLWPPASSGYKKWQEYEKTAESKQKNPPD